MPLIAQIVEPPGGGHQDVHALLQGLHLGALAHAAENDGVAQLQVLAVLVKALLDLEGQLPGGCQHQGADGRVPLVDVAVEPLEDGDGEGGGFAGAGLGATDEVPALERRGHGLGLDGRRLDVAQLIYRAEQLGQQFQFLKCYDSPLQFGFGRFARVCLLYTVFTGNAIPTFRQAAHPGANIAPRPSTVLTPRPEHARIGKSPGRGTRRKPQWNC